MEKLAHRAATRVGRHFAGGAYQSPRIHNAFDGFRHIGQQPSRSFSVYNLSVMVAYDHRLKGVHWLDRRYLALAIEPAESIGHRGVAQLVVADSKTGLAFTSIPLGERGCYQTGSLQCCGDLLVAVTHDYGQSGLTLHFYTAHDPEQPVKLAQQQLETGFKPDRLGGFGVCPYRSGYLLLVNAAAGFGISKTLLLYYDVVLDKVELIGHLPDMDYASLCLVQDDIGNIFCIAGHREFPAQNWLDLYSLVPDSSLTRLRRVCKRKMKAQAAGFGTAVSCYVQPGNAIGVVAASQQDNDLITVDCYRGLR